LLICASIITAGRECGPRGRVKSDLAEVIIPGLVVDFIVVGKAAKQGGCTEAQNKQTVIDFLKANLPADQWDAARNSPKLVTVCATIDTAGLCGNIMKRLNPASASAPSAAPPAAVAAAGAPTPQAPAA